MSGPELGQNSSLGDLLGRLSLPWGHLCPCHGPGPAWAMGALVGCSIVALGAWPHHYGPHLLTPELPGERRHVGLRPVNSFPETTGSDPGCPRCPWGGDIPGAGRCYCSRAPLEDQRSPSPAAQHGTGIPQQARAWLACLLSAQPPGHSSTQHKYLYG